MKFWRNDFVIAFFILLAYLLTNSYVYGWDDQHLEIPLLKHLIDPSLYKGDYYVEGLSRHFSSYLFPILAKFITVAQIPATYLILFLIVRYAMFFWVYKFWHVVAGSRFSALCATLMFFLLGRTEEFLYRTFSHQEMSIAFVFAGMYYFYRQRYILAALIFGVGANIHAIYNLFPMLFLLAFLVLFHPERWVKTFKAGVVFTIACLPFLCWQVFGGHKTAAIPPNEWIPLYLLSCPQNFFFQSTPLAEVLSNGHILLEKLSPYLYLTTLYVFHLCFNPQLRHDKKIHAIISVSWILVTISFIFSYIYPSHLVLDLNLVRAEQFVRFMLAGYSIIFLIRQFEEQKPWLVLLCSLFLLSFATPEFSALAFVLAMSIVLMLKNYMATGEKNIIKSIGVFVFVVIVGALLFLLLVEMKSFPYWLVLWNRIKLAVVGIGVVYVVLRFKPHSLWVRRCFVIVPLLGAFVYFTTYHYQYLKDKAHGIGFWQMQRNWEDMQNYVRQHTPKDALLLTPYDTDLGGFRIRSERKVLVCYRDCGIIGFDYAAAVEWNKRIKDVEFFKMYTQNPVDKSVLTAILKYNVDYIVFMNYYEPRGENPLLQKMYQNDVFALYKVNLFKGTR